MQTTNDANLALDCRTRVGEDDDNTPTILSTPPAFSTGAWTQASGTLVMTLAHTLPANVSTICSFAVHNGNSARASPGTAVNLKAEANLDGTNPTQKTLLIPVQNFIDQADDFLSFNRTPGAVFLASASRVVESTKSQSAQNQIVAEFALDPQTNLVDAVGGDCSLLLVEGEEEGAGRRERVELVLSGLTGSQTVDSDEFEIEVAVRVLEPSIGGKSVGFF